MNSRAQARESFARILAEAKDELNAQILKLRMDMIAHPRVGNVEPFYSEYERCPEPHANTARPSSAWFDDEKLRVACPRCREITERYWRRDAWKKTRGALIDTLRYRLGDYKLARKNLWNAGGHTSWGADHSCWNKWKGFPNE